MRLRDREKTARERVEAMQLYSAVGRQSAASLLRVLSPDGPNRPIVATIDRSHCLYVFNNDSARLIILRRISNAARTRQFVFMHRRSPNSLEARLINRINGRDFDPVFYWDDGQSVASKWKDLRGSRTRK